MPLLGHQAKKVVNTWVKSIGMASLMEKAKSSSLIAVTIEELGKMDYRTDLVFFALQMEDELKANCRTVDGKAELQTMIDSISPTKLFHIICGDSVSGIRNLFI